MSTQRTSPSRGFTLLELLMSILVIGMLMGLLITAAVHVRSVARKTADGQAVLNAAQAASKFRTDFGFSPPLVRDQDTTAGASRVIVPGSGNTPSRLNVRNPVNAGDEAFLRGTTQAYNPSNPLLDTRYSTVSLAAYLAGGVAAPRGGGPDVPPGLPVDGVPGPGFYKPKRDGSFDVAADALRVASAAGATARMGRTFEPMVALEGSGLKLATPGSPPANLDGLAELHDRRNKPLRYYAWVPGDANGRITDNASMNIPAMVGRWQDTAQQPDTRAALGQFKLPPGRDVSANTKLRSARWAVVGAGLDGLFGDESDLEISQVYGGAANAAAQLPNRVKAEADNFVEVGE